MKAVSNIPIRFEALVLVLLFAALFLPGTHAQTRDVVTSLERVAGLIRENKIGEAEQQLTPILKAAPDAAMALNLMGTIRAQQGRLDEAEMLFLRAVRNNSEFVGARMNLAYLYLLKRAPEKTILELKEVLRLEPDNTDVAEKLAGLLLAQGKLDECISVVEKVRLLRSLPPPLLVVLSDAYLKKANLKKAEEGYLLALEGRLDNAGALLGMAQIAQARAETREASLYLSRVGSLLADSPSPDFLYRFALIALRSEMSNEAGAALERAVKLRPEEPAYYLALGIVWLRKGDLFEAEKVFRRTIELRPDSQQGQLHLGYVLLNQKKYGEARQWLEKSAMSKAIVPEVYYYLGLVAQEQNDDLKAIDLFEKTIQRLPRYAHARVALGLSHMKLKNYPRALEELETAVKLDPDDPQAHYNLALLYARLKDPQRAQEKMRIVERLKSKGVAPTDGSVIVVPPASPLP